MYPIRISSYHHQVKTIVMFAQVYPLCWPHNMSLFWPINVVWKAQILSATVMFIYRKKHKHSSVLSRLWSSSKTLRAHFAIYDADGGAFCAECLTDYCLLPLILLRQWLRGLPFTENNVVKVLLRQNTLFNSKLNDTSLF